MNATSEPLPPDEYVKFGHAMGARLIEHFDGLCIIGFHATTGQPVIYTIANDSKTRLALSELLRIAMIQNSIAATHPRPNDNGS